MNTKSKRRVIFYSILIFVFLIVGVAFTIFRWNILNPLKSHSIKIDSISRKFYFHVPYSLSSSPRLIFVLHGSTMTAAQMQLITGHQFDKLADNTRDTIIVYPQGYHKYWNDCRRSARSQAKQNSLNEALFFQEMIAFFKQRHNVDSGKIFLTGFSNGGHMGFKLAQENPELFRGYAIISANLPVANNNDCKESKKPVSLLLINGTADPVNPYDGGKVVVNDGLDRGDVVSTNETMNYWRNLTHCKVDGENEMPDTEESDHSKASMITYLCPNSKHHLKLIKILNGGHNVPNPTFFLWPRNVVGNVNEDLNVPEIIFDYFRELQ
jgi:polyhydroxybutyrate depolymerase